MKGEGLIWPLAIGGGLLALSGVASASNREGQRGSNVPLLPPRVEPRPQPPAGAPAAPPASVEPELYVTDEVEALARIIKSETSRRDEQVMIAWCARNRAKRNPKWQGSIARMACQPCGKQVGNIRPFSSAQNATSETRKLAALVLAAPESEDPTGGADHCLQSGLMDAQHAAGKKGAVRDARGVRFCWLRSLDYYGTFGRWDLFGPKGGRGARPVPREWGLDGYAPPGGCPGDRRRKRKERVA